MDFDQPENLNRGVNKIDEGSIEETVCSADNSHFDFHSSSAYDEGWVGASSFRDMKYKSDEMKNLLKLEDYPDKDKIIKLDYAAEHLFPQWIIENKDWKSTQCKSKENKISDILQIHYGERTLEQSSTLIHWLMSVWPTAYQMGYKRCGQMFKVFQFLTYHPGQDVIVENERGLTFYIVISGSATVHKDGIGVVATISKGMSFGELALTEGNDVRSATVRAQTELELLRLHKVDYDHFVKDIQLAERRENLLVLRDCQIFNDWPRSKIQKMCTTCSRRTYKPGETVFRQGDIPDSIYFIIDGKISIHKEIMIIVRNRWPTGTNEWDGVAKKRIKPHLVGELQRGNFFGELSIIKNKRRTATAKAVTRCVLLCLDKLEFVHLLRSGRAMETVSNYSSQYRDDEEILSQMDILNGGPSTTAQLNEYIKAMAKDDSDTKHIQSRKKTMLKNDPVHSLLASRPKTANARIRNTIVLKLSEEDEKKQNSTNENMKFSTPNRKTKMDILRANAAANSPPTGTRTTLCAAGYSPTHTLLQNKGDMKKQRGVLAGGDTGGPQEETEEDDEAIKKLKVKNENKAAAALADRMKAKLDPLKKTNQKQIKDSQMRLMMQEVVVANRKLAYLDELAAIKLTQTTKKDVATKTDHGASFKGKKLGFAASRRQSVTEERRQSQASLPISSTVIGGGVGSPKKHPQTQVQIQPSPMPSALTSTTPHPTHSRPQPKPQLTSPASEKYIFQAVSKTVHPHLQEQGKRKIKRMNSGGPPQIDFKDKKIIPMMGVIKSVMLESTTGRAIKSESADDIAQYRESTTTGDTKAMPVGKRFTRQNTRDLTEMQTQAIAANATSIVSDPSKEAKLIKRRETEEAHSLDQQENRKKLFQKQGSLRNMLL